jgi:cysteine desulfurase
MEIQTNYSIVTGTEPSFPEVIYLDNNATTPVDPRVLKTMLPYFSENFANAASTHRFGLAAHEAVKKARQQVADLIAADTHEIIFTSGATEAINLAIKGVAEACSQKGKHIVTVSTEHSAVLDTCRYLETKGFEVTFLPVQADGLLDLELVQGAIRPDTILVSVMHVNNETGVIQPIQEIADLAHEKGALFMSDCTQSVGKIPVNVDDLGIDLLCFSAHKVYGPKGIYNTPHLLDQKLQVLS